MNERITLLALKASDPKTGWLDRQKFAELIVRECVEQMELVRKYRYDRVQPLENQQTIIDECQYQIKQHFGVEE